MIVLASFVLLVSLTLAASESRRATLNRNPSDWALDWSGLIVQGIVIPALQTTVVYGLLSLSIPQAKGALDISPLWSFLLNFVAIDYLYYWNHRLLHSNKLWPVHAVHHTPQHIDVFIASRNTLWTPLLIIYVWANGFFIFLLKDPAPFILSASITASLDLWRHTRFAPRPGSRFHRIFAAIFITPNEHMWHHSSDRNDSNFGANLSVWDRIHETYYSPSNSPQNFGVESNLSIKRKMIFPFEA
jgi:sterol desaturase/sphingolipid hydroxylase (fatty acid hydroxylase superfamily)